MLFQETEILRYIAENLRSPVGDAIMKTVSFLGEGGMIFIAAGLLMLCFKKTRPWAWGVFAALLLNLLLVNGILKPLIARPRPWVADPTLIPAGRLPSDMSFPSGHTSAAFAYAFSLVKRKKPVFAASVAFAALMGVSRIYLCVHYPTDVLGGMVFGGICGIASAYLVPALQNNIKIKRS